MRLSGLNHSMSLKAAFHWATTAQTETDEYNKHTTLHLASACVDMLSFLLRLGSAAEGHMSGVQVSIYNCDICKACECVFVKQK